MHIVSHVYFFLKITSALGAALLYPASLFEVLNISTVEQQYRLGIDLGEYMQPTYCQ